MAGYISIKATTIKAERRSRGRVATFTRTILRNVRDDAHPAQIMSVMSALFPLLEHMPAYYRANGVRHELLRIETRTVDGVRVSRAVFKDERSVRKDFAREMRRRHRAARRSDVRAARAESRRRMALACALLVAACAARCTRLAATRVVARVPLPMLTPLSLSPSTSRLISTIPSG